MKRDLQKYVEDYKRKFYGNEYNGGAFYVSDFYQITDMGTDLFDLIDNALMAGFMVGYKKAKREKRG